MRSFLLALGLAGAATPLAAQAIDTGPGAEVRAIVRAFHAALAAGDSAGALTHLHPDVVIYESGHAENFVEYRSGHLASDMRFAAATRRELTAEAVEVRADQALYLAESHTSGRWRDRDIEAHGAETMVLVRIRDGWRIRHIHWSSR